MSLLKLTERWSIGVYTGDTPFTIASPGDVENPVLTARDVTDMDARFVADPFMIRREQRCYMFFEALDDKTGRGRIVCARSDDGLKWSYDRIVLAEPFHLSYPYVFTWDESVYLVPESFEANAIRLYRAAEFPVNWKFVGTLLSGSPYLDSSLIYYHDLWWLFAVDNQRRDRLGLYCAARLEGPWKEHPRSPIVTGNPHLARPGGRVFEYQGRLFRLAQDDYPRYGRQVWAIEVTRLTADDYSEQLYLPRPILRGARRGWNAHGMHHVDPHQLGDRRWIACVDGYRYSLSIGSRFSI